MNYKDFNYFLLIEVNSKDFTSTVLNGAGYLGFNVSLKYKQRL